MLYPDTKKIKNLKKCCKDGRNLNYSHGDGVEWEVYRCEVCGKEFVVALELVRDFKGMEEAI